ncbi:MAG: triose-phosphate isomerase [Patescibacteria group bacterium]
MNQKPLIIANWKMNPATKEEMDHLLGVLKQGITQAGKQEIVICPPFVYLTETAKTLGKQFILGAQDCFWENKGAYTGEISPQMLKDLGCQYVIIGHSERRRYFQETDEIVNKKLKAVLKERLKPILCIGEETRDSFDSQGRLINEISSVVTEQLERALKDIAASRIREIIIAYEPVWAISTEVNGTACWPDDAMKASLFIRKTLTKLYNRQIAEKAKIIYGGSVNSKNVTDYLKNARMDGVLVGGASLNGSEFVKLVEKVR